MFIFYVKDINIFEYYIEMVEYCNGKLIYVLMFLKYEFDFFGLLCF